MIPNYVFHQTSLLSLESVACSVQRPKVKFICFMDIYLLKGSFRQNYRLVSEQHFSRRQRALCHWRKGTFCVFWKLGGPRPAFTPPGSYAPVWNNLSPIIRNSSYISSFKLQLHIHYSSSALCQRPRYLLFCHLFFLSFVSYPFKQGQLASSQSVQNLSFKNFLTGLSFYGTISLHSFVTVHMFHPLSSSSIFTTLLN